MWLVLVIFFWHTHTHTERGGERERERDAQTQTYTHTHTHTITQKHTHVCRQENSCTRTCNYTYAHSHNAHTTYIHTHTQRRPKGPNIPSIGYEQTKARQGPSRTWTIPSTAISLIETIKSWKCIGFFDKERSGGVRKHISWKWPCERRSPDCVQSVDRAATWPKQKHRTEENLQQRRRLIRDWSYLLAFDLWGREHFLDTKTQEFGLVFQDKGGGHAKCVNC